MCHNISIMNISTLPRIIQKNVRDNPDFIAQYSKDKDEVFQSTSFSRLYDEMLYCAAGLKEAGVMRADHVGLISDNRKEWMILSLGLHCLGAADVPRGCDSMADELAYILSFGDCKTAVLENEAQLAKLLPLRDKMPQLSTFIIFDNDFDKNKYSSSISGLKILGFKEIMENGASVITKDGVSAIEGEIDQGKGDEIATIIFTSGTTGEPKGVMLTHKNIMNQAINAPSILCHKPGDIWLTVLPVWHSFERAIQYIALYNANSLAYSKPVGKIMLADFQKIRPNWMAAVPRLWEALRTGVYRNAAASKKTGALNFFVKTANTHETMKNLLLGLTPQFHKRCVPLDMLFSFIPFLVFYPVRALANALVFKKVKAMLGGKFKGGISGGAALPDAVDKFFAAAGIKLLEGYGLTETAPILAVRYFNHPVAQTIGPAFPNMEIEIRDPETGKEVKPGKKGVLYTRGVQVMQGYYKKPEETKKVIDDDGWFNTGDIGKKTWKGELKLTGRAKDTIVLLGGENVEPVPIENKIRDSEYIDHAVVLGQDQKFLAALIVPNFERIEAYAKENSISYIDNETLVRTPEIRELIQLEINDRVNRKTGFRGFERIFKTALLPKTFEAGKELSGKQDYKRRVITDMYKKEIAELFTDQ